MLDFGGKVKRLFKSPFPDPPILSHAGLSPVNLLLRGARVTGAGVRAGPGAGDSGLSGLCSCVSVAGVSVTGGEAPCPPPVTSPAPSHWSGHGPGGHTGDDTLTSGRTWYLP